MQLGVRLTFCISIHPSQPNVCVFNQTKCFSSCLWTPTLSMHEILLSLFLQESFQRKSQWAQWSWILWFLMWWSHTLCPLEPQAANIKSWQWHQNFLCQGLPENSNPKQYVLGVNNSCWETPAGLKCLHTNDFPLGFGSCPWRLYLGIATLRKLPGGT